MGKKVRLTVEQLKHFEPICALSDERLDELVTLAYIDRISIGVSVFREGDVDNQTIYLLAGDVQLMSTDGSIDKVLSASAEQARFPLDDSQPRQMSCVANGPVELLRIDNSVLDYMMMWDQLAAQTVIAPEPEVEPKVEAKSPDKAEPEAKTETTIETGSEPAAKPQSQPQQSQPQQSQPQQSQTPQQPDVAGAQDDAAKADSKPNATRPADVKAGSSATVKSAVKSSVEDKAAKARMKSELPASASPAGGQEPGAWMRRMSHIMAFKNMPPANIRTLLERMEQVAVDAGETIVQQGEKGEYYYVLTDGSAKVTRTVELAELKPGASFGEESLVAGTERNASITMLTDGTLMRLSKQDFNELLKEPMLCRMSPDEARVQAAKGDVWLDVRHAREYNHGRLRKAVSIPLHELRSRLDELDKNKQYICYCNTGRRSSAAAFLLVQNGFKACVLNGGVRVMPQDLES